MKKEEGLRESQMRDVKCFHQGVSNKGKIGLGNPYVDGASITVKILEHNRDKKILVYKKKRRKGYQRKNDHRQHFTLLEVLKVEAKSPAKPKKKEEK